MIPTVYQNSYLNILSSLIIPDATFRPLRFHTIVYFARMPAIVIRRKDSSILRFRDPPALLGFAYTYGRTYDRLVCQSCVPRS